MSGLAAEAADGGLQGVLFDMDGLLVDSEPLWYEIECEIMERLGGEWGPADQLHLIGGTLGRSVGYMLGKAARPVSPETVADWLTGGMAALVARRGVPMMPGARELLMAVGDAGLPHALVTSAERPIMMAALASIGAGFATTVCADDVVKGKPDPEPYLLAASRLRVDARCCVALEDSPSGVASAEAAGCAVVAVPGPSQIGPRPGRLVVGSLKDVDLQTLRDLAAPAGG